MNDHIRKAGEFVRDAVVEGAQQRASDRDLDMQARGFKSAAGITQRLIQDKLDTFKAHDMTPETRRFFADRASIAVFALVRMPMA